MHYPIATAPRNGMRIVIGNGLWSEFATFFRARDHANPLNEDAWLLHMRDENNQVCRKMVSCAECDATHWCDATPSRTYALGRRVKLEKVSEQSPEAYAIYDDEGRTVGYFRLSSGHFTVEALYASGRAEIVHKAVARGECRFADDERDGHLAAGLSSLLLNLSASQGLQH